MTDKQENSNRRNFLAGLPLGRLAEPELAANFAATLIDGVGKSQTGQFFSIDNGWAFQ